MPIIKSAKKRVRVIAKKSVENSKTKRSLRESIKAFQNALKSGKKVSDAQKNAQSAIDFAVKKGIISKNKAARKKSQLNAVAKASGSTTKVTAKKAAKPVAKSPTKKPAAKKTSAKKTTVKKTAKK